MKCTKIFLFPVILFSFLFFCGDEGLRPDEKEYIIPASNISYYEHLQPMFEGKCGYGSGCHNETYDGGSNFLFFSTKEFLIEHPIPGSIPETKLLDPLLLPQYQVDPERSPLYLLLTEKIYFTYERQPPASYGRAPLTENQLNGILQWIREGASN